MKRKSPITITSVKLSSYTHSEEETKKFSLEKLHYKRYRDFAVDDDYANIAVKLEIYNRHEDRGIRRSLKLAVVDLSSRYEVESQSIKVSIGKDEQSHEIFVAFPHLAAGMTGTHSYILMIFDEAYSELISMTPFQLHDCKILGDPTEWFGFIYGGIRPARESTIYQVLQVREDLDYYVRFSLSPSFKRRPTFLPELKIRLYSPERMLYLEDIQVPEYDGCEYYDEDFETLIVEFPLITPEDKTCSTFYAELLCMGHPIAGFVFDTNMEDQTGEWGWDDEEMEPLAEYTPDAAAERLLRFLDYKTEEEEEKEEEMEEEEESEESVEEPEEKSETSASTDLDDEFAKLLDDFLARDARNKSEDSEDCGDSENAVSGDTSASTSLFEFDDDDSDISGVYHKPDTSEETRIPLLASLNHLTGLYSVKEKLTVYENVVRFNKIRKDNGLPTSPTPLHAMFLGLPGTGKTTVAKLMGEMLHRAGILSKGHVVVRERSTLMGIYYGSQEEKTLEALKEAQGGILFIDEAHQLFLPDDPRDPGKLVIETLITALADEDNRDWMLILAGYPAETRRLFDLNPGLKSRIPDSNIYTFDDFTAQELMEIATNYITRHQYTLTPAAQYALAERLEADYKTRDRTFGNARHVINLIQTEILPSMAVRVISEGLSDNESLTQIQLSDIIGPSSNSTSLCHRLGFSLS